MLTDMWCRGTLSPHFSPFLYYVDRHVVQGNLFPPFPPHSFIMLTDMWCRGTFSLHFFSIPLFLPSSETLLHFYCRSLNVVQIVGGVKWCFTVLCLSANTCISYECIECDFPLQPVSRTLIARFVCVILVL